MVKAASCGENPQENKEQMGDQKFHKDDPVFKQILEGRPFPTSSNFKNFKFTFAATSDFGQKLMEQIASETEKSKEKLNQELSTPADDDKPLDRLAHFIEEVLIREVPKIIEHFVENYVGPLTEDEKEEIERFVTMVEPEFVEILKWLCHHIYEMAENLCHKGIIWLKSAAHHLVDLVSHHLRA